ncbi:UDP-N-acetylmuramate dehydrogenase [Alkalimarinus alittae]|uniref:UDP-N-acetylenolpyruvoylglucosamine reductase n=1 Tax=Alkalimarinus alittae TaxID=2961619 RepID=A0ABY6N7L3_9ALTE|nr:UDP-N-acetylmuramate dehydrogenase [Alkalimarinus alittae]UZE97957.1 UDP-N-acetylmuramate dehydrogenase [Alkalimarinus alittae]
MKYEKNVDLTSLNTLNIQSIAEYFYEVYDVSQLIEALSFARANNLGVQILGGGSNVILPSVVSGVVIRMAIAGRELKPINSSIADFIVGAGEDWHEFVLYTLQQGYPGLENLSLIPGTVGAAPVQNIGAYGVEVKDMLTEVTVIDVESDGLEQYTLQNEQLDFEYRNSLLKKNPGKYVITSATFRLDKHAPLKTTYGDIAERLVDTEISALTVSNAVIAARKSKLPDVLDIPNAGSFFKNPIVSHDKLQQLKIKHPKVISYKVDESSYKLAAGWLIQEAGWKGYRNEKVGVHAKQALVLVNHNHGVSEDILGLAKKISVSVESMFGVALEIEPVVI